MLLIDVNDPLAVPARAAAIAACLDDMPAPSGPRITASVGTAVFPEQARNLQTLLELADRAMYDVKDAAGRVRPPYHLPIR